MAIYILFFVKKPVAGTTFSMVSALLRLHRSFRLVKRKFWWSSRAEFDVFCAGFPQSVEVERLLRETRRRDIFPLYTRLLRI